MLIAVKIENSLVKIYHWSPGGCATLRSSQWAGWSTPYESSHPAQSQNEFIHKCVTDTRDYFIKADEDGLIIMQGKETLVERTIDEL
jgi:hypothetical protein